MPAVCDDPRRPHFSVDVVGHLEDLAVHDAGNDAVGVVASRARRYVSLRREDLEWSFPGLIGPIIKAAAAR